MKRSAALLSTLPLLFWIAQGCSSTTTTTDNGSGGDDGGGSGGDDGGGTNPGDDGGSGTKKDSGGDDAGTIVQTTPGTQLVMGKGITLYGITGDNYVVFGKDTGKADDAGNALTDLEVVPVAGGTPTVLSPVLDFSVDDFAIAGSAIAYYKSVDQSSGVAASLSVWTAANAGLKQVGTNAIDGIFDASADGTHVIFTSNVNATNATADMVVTKADGTGSVAMYTTFSLKNCQPVAAFQTAVAYGSTCTGAATTAVINTLDTSNAANTVNKSAGTAAKQGFVSMDGNATHLVYIKNTNSVGTVVPFGGGTAVAHTANTAFATLNTDASKILFRTDLADGGAGELAVGPATTNTAPTVLVPTVASVLGVASDFSNGVVAIKGVDQTTNKDIPRADLNFASLSTAGAPTALTAAGLPVGFNSTNTHFFFLTDLPASGQTPIATLNAHAAAGGADKVIAKNIIEPKLVTGTTKAVYMENIQADANMNVFIDLTVGDPTAAMPTVIVQGADPGFEVSSTKMLVYTNAAKGMYAVAVP